MSLYSIKIPNDKAKTYKIVTYVTGLMNLFFFGYLMVFMVENGKQPLFLIGFFLSVTSLLFYFLQKKGKRLGGFRIEIYFIVCGLIWCMAGRYGLGLLLELFAIMGFVNNKELRIDFSRNGIRYPSFPVKKIEWKEVDFVILKDEILTIELKKNQLFQFTLESEVASKIDADAFNAFCVSQVTI